MLVTTVQGLVGTFHENLTPLNQAGRCETRNRTDNYFLDKGRLHPLCKSTSSAMVEGGSRDAENRSASAAGSYYRPLRSTQLADRALSYQNPH